MNIRLGFRIALLLALAVCAQLATADGLALSHATLARLTALPRGEALAIDAFPVGPTHTASIRFERVQIYANDAHLYVMTATGRHEVPRSTRIFLRGYSDDGSARVAMSLNPDSSFAEGNGSGPEGSFVLRARVDAGGGANRLIAQSLESTLPAGFKFNFRCGNENENMDVHALDDFAKRLGITSGASTVSTAATTSHALRLATVAVDTDSLFMSRLFSNNTTSAGNWIAGMFNTMNTMYERDLLVELYQGTTFYQTNSATDPYTSANIVPANTTDLDIFAAYWKTNHSTVTRAFAILLSGQETSTSTNCGASGIGWIDQYCQKGFPQGSDTVGSYSVNQVCTNINIDPDGTFDAGIVGHEIGHNFGAYHTHCTNTSTGLAPTGTNTIDQCYNTESGCYSGTPSCPAAGAGTIMSYCNFTNISGCASGTQNLLQFHPTQVTVLDGYISGQSACLNETADIFYNGFE